MILDIRLEQYLNQIRTFPVSRTPRTCTHDLSVVCFIFSHGRHNCAVSPPISFVTGGAGRSTAFDKGEAGQCVTFDKGEVRPCVAVDNGEAGMQTICI